MVASTAAGATVASAAIQLSLVHHPVIVGTNCMPSPPPPDDDAVDGLFVEKLKEQLITIEQQGGDQGAALDTIEKLEALSLTREILEVTRIGVTVNEIRRRYASTWPELSKRCRSLIRAWQKVAEMGAPSSSCDGSSNGGTPSLVSPGLGGPRRGLTPKTPLLKHVAPAISIEHRSTPTSSETSPSSRIARTNGNYAPPLVVPPSSDSKALISAHDEESTVKESMAIVPQQQDMESQFSQDSLPNDSDASTLVDSRRRGAASHGERTPIPTITLKRTKAGSNLRASSKSGSGSPPISYHAVSAARKNVQSTAQLIAQMSETLPDHVPAWACPAAEMEVHGDERTRTSDDNAAVGWPPTGASLPALPRAKDESSTEPSPTLGDDEGTKEERRRERKRLKTERKEEKRATKLAKRQKKTAEEEGTLPPPPPQVVAAGAGPASANEVEESQKMGKEQKPTADATIPAGEQKKEEEPAQSTSRGIPSRAERASKECGGVELNCWYGHLVPAIVQKLETENGEQPTAPVADTISKRAQRRHLLLLPYIDFGAPNSAG